MDDDVRGFLKAGCVAFVMFVVILIVVIVRPW